MHSISTFPGKRIFMTATPTETATKWRQISDEEHESTNATQVTPAKFAEFYDRYVQAVYRYLYYRTGNSADAEDLTSQTFLSALETLPKYQHKGMFAAWIFRIARGKTIDHLRRQKKQQPLDDAHPAEASDLLSQAADADEIATLTALIRDLDENEQELVRLRYTAGLPFAQIASLLDSNENTVKKSTYRILARLHKELEKSHG
jgi:RNA polymerase sigma-70 factor, ECF subfamily